MPPGLYHHKINLVVSWWKLKSSILPAPTTTRKISWSRGENSKSSNMQKWAEYLIAMIKAGTACQHNTYPFLNKYYFREGVCFESHLKKIGTACQHHAYPSFKERICQRWAVSLIALIKAGSACQHHSYPIVFKREYFRWAVSLIAMKKTRTACQHHTYPTFFNREQVRNGLCL